MEGQENREIGVANNLDYVSDDKNGLKKRKSTYSRKGCLQCKKAHTKCDERKPQCTRCAKRAINCTYKNHFVFQKNEFSSSSPGLEYVQSGLGTDNLNNCIDTQHTATATATTITNTTNTNTNNNTNINNNAGINTTNNNNNTNNNNRLNQQHQQQQQHNLNSHAHVVNNIHNNNSGQVDKSSDPNAYGVGPTPMGIPVPAGYHNASMPLQVVGTTSSLQLPISPTPGSTINSPIGNANIPVSNNVGAYVPTHQGPMNLGTHYPQNLGNPSGVTTLPPLNVELTQGMGNQPKQTDDSPGMPDHAATQQIKGINGLQQQQQPSQQYPDQRVYHQTVSPGSKPYPYPSLQYQRQKSGGLMASDTNFNTHLYNNGKLSNDPPGTFPTDIGFDHRKLYQSVKQSLAPNANKNNLYTTTASSPSTTNVPLEKSTSNLDYRLTSDSKNNGTSNDSFSISREKSGSALGTDTDGNNLDSDIVNIRDYIYISPTDWNFLNLLRFDQNDTRDNTPELEQSMQTNLFQLCWRGASSSEIHSVFNSYDPIQILYATENPSTATTIPLDDPKLLNFIWTVVRTTLLCGNLILFPFKDHFDPLLDIFISMGRKYPLMKDVFVYVASLFMKDTYYNSNLKYFAHIWDRYVRMPTLKRCLDQLTVLIRKSNDYCDNISLAFTVTLLFAANSANKSTEWRTHLRGVHDLFQRVERLKPSQIKDENTEKNAHECYLFVKDWFCHAEVLAWITSDNGGCFNSQEDLEKLLNQAAYSKYNLLNGRLDLIRGYTADYYPIFTMLSSNLLKSKKQGKPFSGTNMLRSYFLESDSEVLDSLKNVGLNALALLRNIPIDDEYLNQATIGLSDVRLKLSMKNCTRMYHYALELYLEIFFLRKQIVSQYVQPRLEKMLECLFSIPFQSTCSITCHWPIYLGALISLLIKDQNLYSHYTSVLKSFVTNGMNVASNSLERLSHISKALSYGDYNSLVDPAHDYIVY